MGNKQIPLKLKFVHNVALVVVALLAIFSRQKVAAQRIMPKGAKSAAHESRKLASYENAAHWKWSGRAGLLICLAMASWR